MPIGSIVFLGLVLVGFAVFAAALAWADAQTRNLPRPPARAQPPADQREAA
jgi:hypothetical protein